MPEPARPTALRGRVFRGRDAVAVGLVTRKQLSSRAWRRLFRDVYVDATLPETHGVAVAGAALIVPRTAVFAGRSAAYLLGAESLVDAVTPVEVVVPDADRFGPVSGLRIRRASLPSSDVRSVSRYRCTTPVRTALDLACLEPMPDSVIALDVLLGRGLVHTRTTSPTGPPPCRAGVASGWPVDQSPSRTGARGRLRRRCCESCCERPA